MAASRRSAEFAYRIGSPRHDSRYSAIDMSLSLRASNDRAKALNRESLYIYPAPHLVAAPLEREVASSSRRRTLTVPAPRISLRTSLHWTRDRLQGAMQYLC